MAALFFEAPMAVSPVTSFIPIVDANGVPYASARVFVCDVGTTTLKSVYSDDGFTIPAANPITVSNGRHAIRYIGAGTYKIQTEINGTDTIGSGTTLTNYSWDDIDPGVPVGAGALPVASGGTGATTAAGARTSLGAASATEMSTAQSDITALEASLGDLATEDLVTTALIAAGAVTAAKAAAGFFVQMQTATYVASADITAALPIDDTIPQIGEGVEILTLNITPSSTSNKILLFFNGMCATASATNTIGAAIFRNATAGAIVANAVNPPNTGLRTQLPIVHVDSPASIAATTYSVRVGTQAGDTIRFNGSNTARTFGGVAITYLIAIEVRA